METNYKLSEADILFQQGVALLQQGKLLNALQLLHKGIVLAPQHEALCNKLVEVLSLLGEKKQLPQGEAFATGITAVFNDLGNAFFAQNKTVDAMTCYREAIRLKSDSFEAICNLGNAFKSVGELEAATVFYRQALDIRPENADIHYNLGNLLQQQGKISDAITAFEQALQFRPDFPAAQHNLGNAYKNEGNYAAAEHCYKQLLVKQGADADVYNNLGLTKEAQGLTDEAIYYFKEAVNIQPNFADAHNNLGIAHSLVLNYEAAEACFLKAIAIDPSSAKTYTNLGKVLMDQGKSNEAINAFRQALAIKRDCMEAYSNLLFALSLDPNCDVAAHQRERKQWADIHEAPIIKPDVVHANLADPKRRLRIGYVSADFRQHATAYTFAPMLLNYNAAEFDVFCYSNVVRPDNITERFKQSVTEWRSILGLSDIGLSEKIKEDKIDILVDLSGHTAGSRLMAFARKPAPVQVTAWGDSTGTGLRSMDYLFSDNLSIPEEEHELYSEEITYLPCRLCYEPLMAMPDVSDLPAKQNSYVTFGYFNDVRKLSQQTLVLWSEILTELKDSRLLLKARGCDTDDTKQRVLNVMSHAGIASERIKFLGNTSHETHLQKFNQADIALDPFPFGGGVTTLETLWMGVPVVTLYGKASASRVAAGILNAVGLNDFIANDTEMYKAIAIKTAKDINKLAALRTTMRETLRTTPVFNSAQYVGLVEAAYRSMWRTWCER